MRSPADATAPKSDLNFSPPAPRIHTTPPQTKQSGWPVAPACRGSSQAASAFCVALHLQHRTGINCRCMCWDTDVLAWSRQDETRQQTYAYTELDMRWLCYKENSDRAGTTARDHTCQRPSGDSTATARHPQTQTEAKQRTARHARHTQPYSNQQHKPKANPRSPQNSQNSPKPLPDTHKTSANRHAPTCMHTITHRTAKCPIGRLARTNTSERGRTHASRPGFHAPAPAGAAWPPAINPHTARFLYSRHNP